MYELRIERPGRPTKVQHICTWRGAVWAAFLAQAQAQTGRGRGEKVEIRLKRVKSPWMNTTN